MGIIKTASGDVQVPFDDQEIPCIESAVNARLALMNKNRLLGSVQALEALCLKIDIPWLYGLRVRKEALELMQKALEEIRSFEANNSNLIDHYEIRDEITAIRTSIGDLFAAVEQKKATKEPQKKK